MASSNRSAIRRSAAGETNAARHVELCCKRSLAAIRLDSLALLQFFHDRNFFDVTCVKLLISKVLSIGIICGAVLVKVPQIINIVRSRSTEGLAASMYALENVGYLITVLYNLRQGYAFSTYGETFFLLLQGIVLIALFGIFNKRLPFSVALYAFYAALGYYIWELSPHSQLPLFQTLTIPIFAASRLPQIVSNFNGKSTGILSVVTVTLNAFGSLARVFTTLAEVEDNVVLAGMLASCAMNIVLLLQVIAYWKNTTKLQKEKPTKAKLQSGAAAAASTTADADAASATTASGKKKGAAKAVPTKPKKQE